MQIVSSLILAAGLLMANVNACEEYKKHTIKAKGIEASFIEYGATITVRSYNSESLSKLS